jgi:hypothetical protein
MIVSCEHLQTVGEGLQKFEGPTRLTTTQRKAAQSLRYK